MEQTHQPAAMQFTARIQARLAMRRPAAQKNTTTWTLTIHGSPSSIHSQIFSRSTVSMYFSKRTPTVMARKAANGFSKTPRVDRTKKRLILPAPAALLCYRLLETMDLCGFLSWRLRDDNWEAKNLESNGNRRWEGDPVTNSGCWPKGWSRSFVERRRHPNRVDESLTYCVHAGAPCGGTGRDRHAANSCVRAAIIAPHAAAAIAAAHALHCHLQHQASDM